MQCPICRRTNESNLLGGEGLDGGVDAKLGVKEDNEFKREERYVMLVGLL